MCLSDYIDAKLHGFFPWIKQELQQSFGVNHAFLFWKRMKVVRLTLAKYLPLKGYIASIKTVFGSWTSIPDWPRTSYNRMKRSFSEVIAKNYIDEVAYYRTS